MNLQDLLRALPLAWNEETRGNDRNPKGSEHPASGQCIVSSLLIQRHFGGIIVRCNVGRTYNQIVHYFNDIDGVMIDSTRAQFRSVSPYSSFKKSPDPKTYIFDGDSQYLGTLDRVDLLEHRVYECM